METDTQKIINAIAALRSAVKCGEDWSQQLEDDSNSALMEIAKYKQAMAKPAPAKAP